MGHENGDNKGKPRDDTCKACWLKQLTVSSIFLQGYDTPRYVKVIEVNQAIKRYCLTQGLDCINHGNIAFKHLDHGGMHLSPEGNCLFAKNINSHVMSG